MTQLCELICMLLLQSFYRLTSKVVKQILLWVVYLGKELVVKSKLEYVCFLFLPNTETNMHKEY